MGRKIIDYCDRCGLEVEQLEKAYGDREMCADCIAAVDLFVEEQKAALEDFVSRAPNDGSTVADKAKYMPRADARELRGKVYEFAKTCGHLVLSGDVIRHFNLTEGQANGLLGRMVREGMLRRVSRGCFAPAKAEATQ